MFGVEKSGNDFLALYPRNKTWWRLASRVVMTAVGMTSKVYTNWYHRTQVDNADVFQESLRQARLENRGLITFMNHVSILDDPLIWGILPYYYYYDLQTMRWALGAKDICFKNKYESTFFSLGQVLSVSRFGQGPFQPAMDAGICLLNQSKWLHVFPEGFVHQPVTPHENTLRYFRWGTSRLILESEKPPIVLPIYGTGLDSIYPEDKPKRLLGFRQDTAINYIFGQPINPHQINDWRSQWISMANKYDPNENSVPENLKLECQPLHSAISSEMRQALLNIKRTLGHAEEDPRLGDAKFWTKDQTEVKMKGLSHELKLLKANKNH